MNESNKRFVDQLFAADPPSAAARQHYENEMRSMLEKRLTRGERREHLIVFVVMGLLGSGVAVICGSSMLTGWPRFPEREDSTFVLTFFLLTAMALLAVALICLRAYQRGAIQRRTTSPWVARAGMAYVGSMGCLLLFMAHRIPEMLRDEVRGLGLVLIGLAMVAWVRHCVWEAELRTAEKLLEIELRLAEIGEALQVKRTPADPAP
jgi:hypothetical protein